MFSLFKVQKGIVTSEDILREYTLSEILGLTVKKWKYPHKKLYHKMSQMNVKKKTHKTLQLHVFKM